LVVFLNTVAFVMGFTLVFVLLGASLGAVSDQVSESGLWLARVGGLVIITFGLISMGLLKIPFLMQERTLAMIPGRNVKYLGSFVVGSTMGVGWVPCVGPLLGSILVLAGTTGSVAQGSLLLFFYSTGMMIPFLAFGLFAGWGTRFIRQHGQAFRYSGIAAGALLIVLGIIVFTDNLREITGSFGFLAQV
jgi:cytochrome c-type biogenesis protein